MSTGGTSSATAVAPKGGYDTFLAKPGVVLGGSIPMVMKREFRTNISDFITKNEMSTNMTTAIVWAMLFAAQMYFGVTLYDSTVALPTGGYTAAHALMTIRMAPVPGATGGTATVVVPSVVLLDGGSYPQGAKDDDYTIAYYSFVSALVANGFMKPATHVLELCVANGVKLLDEANIGSYFAMNGVPSELAVAPILSTVNFLTSMIPPSSFPKELINRIDACIWLRYHTTYASGVGLVKRFLDSTSQGAIFGVTAATLALVQAAFDKPWDMKAADKIPLILKGLAFVFLGAINQLPANRWYQGEKGKELLAPTIISAVKVWALKTQELASNTVAITGATSAAAADAALAAVPGLPTSI